MLLGQVETTNELKSIFHGLLAKLVDVHFASFSALDCDGENFRFKPRTSTDLARFACHEGSNAITREFTLRLLIKPLHLWHESLERFFNFLFAVAGERHFDGLAIRAEVQRGLECVGQICERHVFVHVEVFGQGILQMTIVGSHAFCAAAPWCDCSFGQRLSLVGDQ